MDCIHPTLEALHFCNKFVCTSCGQAFTRDEAVEVFNYLKKIADHNYKLVHAQEEHIDNFYETRPVKRETLPE